MRFRMLGPLLVDDGASWSAIRATQQRLVAAVLLLQAGRAVPVERLVDELWGERPPPTAAATVRGYVMRLRRLLSGGPGGPLVTRGRGYELDVEDGDVDARVCGYLPLALRIAAANLSGRPRTTLAAYAAELAAGDRLRALEVGEDSDAAVRVAFDRSYAALPAAARRLFRLLGLVPGAGIGPRAAAALAATDAAAAAALLDRLASAHLAGERAPNRYVLHDLVRRYAADRARAEDSPADREAALGRLLDHYLHGVDPDLPAAHRQHTPSR
jgi:hypothetical protein